MTTKTKPLFALDVEGENLSDILDAVCGTLKSNASFSEEEFAELENKIQGAIHLDSIEQGVVLVHHQVEKIDDVEIIVRTKNNIASTTGSDGLPLRFIWILLSNQETHPRLARAAEFINLLKEPKLRKKLLTSKTGEEFLKTYEKGLTDEVEFEHHIPPELMPTGKFAGGLMADISRSLKTYGSDFTDGLNSKSLASVFFLFFACLAPAIAFGGLLENFTGGAVGVTEMIVATAICGVTYSLISAQPLTILGSTGPVIIFMGLLYPLCLQYNIPYLPTLACVGLWTMVFLVILALIDACSWIRFFTRFTDDTFAALISIIFIYEALKSMIGGFEPDQTGTVFYDKAFFALILGLGTYYIGTGLSKLRSSVYLIKPLRDLFADFGTTIAIVAMLILSMQFKDINIPRLDVPEKLEPSSIVLTQDALNKVNVSDELKSALENNPSLLNASESLVKRANLSAEDYQALTTIKATAEETVLKESEKRSWFVNPLDAPQWVIWISTIPALLLSILLYLDQNITVRLVNNAQYKLKKGAGYHLDLLVVAFLVGVCSLLGLPWMVAATVRSLNHVRSLVKVETDKNGNEVIVGTVETRMTGLLVHVAVGASLLLLFFLKHIPMAVLFGLFLYMGVASMKGNQLFERLRLWIMDPAKYPPNYYIRAVPTKQIHLFTLIQTLSLAVLWIVKTSAVAILFPLFIAFLVPVRMLLNKYFEKEHLALLDAEEEPDEEQYNEID